MSNSSLFQNKLASIMEVLVNSAVADICRLVDDGAAVLHLEISRSKTENDDLRLKLHFLERELETAKRGKHKSLNSVGVQCVDLGEHQELSITIKQENPNSFDEDKEGITEGNRILSGISSTVQCQLDGLDNNEVWALPQQSGSPDRSGATGLAKRPNYSHWDRSRPICSDTSKPGVSQGKTNQSVRTPEIPCGFGSSTARNKLKKTPRLRSRFDVSNRHDGLLLKCENPPSCERDCLVDEKAPQAQAPPQRRTQLDGELRDRVVCDVQFELDEDGGHQLLQDSAMTSHPQRKPKLEMEEEDSSSSQAEHPLPNLSPSCLYPTASDLTLALHGMPGGSMRTDTVPGPSAARPHVCPQCGRAFAHTHVLKRHMLVHTGIRPHACGFCGKRFSLLDSLRRHQRIHTGERPYGCQLCGKRFTQRTHLNIHLSVHTGVRPFTCMQCGRSFTQTHVLRRHMRVHAAEGFTFYPPNS